MKLDSTQTEIEGQMSQVREARAREYVERRLRAATSEHIAMAGTFVDRDGFIVEPGHPQEGCLLMQCQGWIEDVEREIKERKHIGECMTNFDHSINADAIARLRAAPHEAFGQYSGWNFCGYVWFDSVGKWHCEVWVRNALREELIADSPEDLMALVSEKYGAE